jgi:hydroxyacylglutathione hydrolase
LIEVKQFRSAIFTSNTYSISFPDENEEVYLVDCGEFQNVIDSFKETSVLKGIFITHYHYDHIYFLEQWLKKFPDVMIFCSELTKSGIASPKQNLSFYHNDPIAIDMPNCKILTDEAEIAIGHDLKIKAIITEGHCEGCTTFIFGKHIFTGDALIPNISVVTKLKSGNKLQAGLSVEKIKSFCEHGSCICPGHLDMIESSNVNWKNYYYV